MKNSKYLFALLIFLLTYQLQAQLSIGVKGGYTNAWEEYGDVDLPDNAIIDVNGINFSLLSYVQVNKHFQVGIEPGYVRRGAACKPGWNIGINPIFEGDTKFLLHYIELPVMLSAHLPFYKNIFEFSAKIGYGGAFLAKAIEETTIIGSENPPSRTSIDLGSSSLLNRWDHGFYSGIKLAYNMGSRQFFIESDLYLAFKDTERNNVSKNRSVNFNIGYLILLGTMNE